MTKRKGRPGQKRPSPQLLTSVRHVVWPCPCRCGAMVPWLITEGPFGKHIIIDIRRASQVEVAP